MTTVLQQIIDGVKADLVGREQRTSVAELQQLIAAIPPALNPMDSFKQPGLSVIAEVKRRSPSKGNLAEISNPAELALAYQAGGAGAISVLTEARRFGGSLADLSQVRAQVSIPILRKDFMVSEYQITEARAYGADIILLIVAALAPAQLAEFQAQATELGMTSLVEVHDEEEAEIALEVGAELIGVNARNLKTLAVDPNMFARVAPMLPAAVTKVAESGIADVAAAGTYAQLGADVVLVGEALVKSGDPAATVAAMRGLK